MNKKTLSISLLALLISQNAFATHAKKEYVIGLDPTVGGTIFWLNASSGPMGAGDHGLVAAAEDLDETLRWSSTSGVISTLGNGFGGGQMNTTLIIAHDIDNAASKCASYCTSSNGGQVSCPNDGVGFNRTIYSDWYLPSAYELAQLLRYYASLDSVQRPAGITYWSSNEVDLYSALALTSFSFQHIPGPVEVKLKTTTLRVHCIRKF